MYWCVLVFPRPGSPHCPLCRLGSVLPAFLPSLLLLTLPGQGGPSAALLAPPAQFALEFRRVDGRHGSGDQLWWLELRRNGSAVARWPAASGVVGRQRADRRWSPGNGAPLPPGLYRLGRPEAWAGSYWIDLLPRFATSRSALGIHTCLPGTGCICLPNAADTAAVARWIQATGLRQLKVVN
jgi:hypothetical protein